MSERVIKTWYRCLLEDGSVWCETSSQRECVLSAQSAPGPIRFESFAVVQCETPWVTWEPTSEMLARARQDYADEEAERA